MDNVMGTRQKFKSGDEFDAILNRDEHGYLYKPGVTSRIKKAMRKRRRIELKKEAKDDE
jgi:hypothetical protein